MFLTNTPLKTTTKHKPYTDKNNSHICIFHKACLQTLSLKSLLPTPSGRQQAPSLPLCYKEKGDAECFRQSAHRARCPPQQRYIYIVPMGRCNGSLYLSLSLYCSTRRLPSFCYPRKQFNFCTQSRNYSGLKAKFKRAIYCCPQEETEPVNVIKNT